MKRLTTLLVLVAALVAGNLFVQNLAFGTETLAKNTQLACGACHDKPGSKLLTDKGKYYELMRTTEGFDDLKATFGACTSCHVRKPGSHDLTRRGQAFLLMVKDMEGLREWMKAHHPAKPAKAPAGDEKP
ncbi:MAG TPA: hypothetical protein PK413_10815 [Thermoanaerobaculia bacterium]|nr:hypothetical protein [Thermoanaerobaculia bacterium]